MSEYLPIVIAKPVAQHRGEDISRLVIDGDDLLSLLPCNFLFSESEIALPRRFFEVSGERLVKRRQYTWAQVLAALPTIDGIRVDCGVALALAVLYWLDFQGLPIKTNWLGGGGIANGSTFSQLRCTENYGLLKFAASEHCALLPDKTLYCYVRGAAYYYYHMVRPDMFPREFQSSYQGENTLYLGVDRFVTFWRNPDGSGSYKIASYGEILRTLGKRGTAEWHRCADERLREALASDFPKVVVCPPAGGRYSFADPMACAGIEMGCDLFVDVEAGPTY
jgi:hypothetical protein